MIMRFGICMCSIAPFNECIFGLHCTSHNQLLAFKNQTKRKKQRTDQCNLHHIILSSEYSLYSFRPQLSWVTESLHESVTEQTPCTAVPTEMSCLILQGAVTHQCRAKTENRVQRGVGLQGAMFHGNASRCIAEVALIQHGILTIDYKYQYTFTVCTCNCTVVQRGFVIVWLINFSESNVIFFCYWHVKENNDCYYYCY